MVPPDRDTEMTRRQLLKMGLGASGTIGFAYYIGTYTDIGPATTTLGDSSENDTDEEAPSHNPTQEGASEKNQIDTDV